MINKSSLLAIKALAVLAQLHPGEWEGTASIARKISAPANYLGKLLQGLVPSGLVVSQKGKGGGFRLGKSPTVVRLLDIVASIEDVSKWSQCFLGRKQCSDHNPCSVHNHWKKVKETNIQYLENITLYDLSR